MNQSKITFVHTSFKGIGGVESVTEMLIQQLNNEGYVVEKISLDNYNFHNFFKKILLFSFLYIPFLDYQINNKSDSDLIITIGETGIFLKPKFNRIHLFHGSYYGYQKFVRNKSIKVSIRNYIGSFLQYLAAKNAYVICVSSFIKKILQQQRINVDKIIPNGVEDSLITKSKKHTGKKIKAVTFGASIYEKGFDRLVEISKIENLEIHQFGQVNIKNNKIKQHGTKARKELLERLQCYDIFIFPSRFEAMQLSPLEAMASGLPVLMSSVGIGEEIREKCADFVVDDWTVENIEERLKIIFSNYEHFSEISLSIAKQYSLTKFKENYSQTINDRLRNRI